MPPPLRLVVGVAARAPATPQRLPPSSSAVASLRCRCRRSSWFSNAEPGDDSANTNTRRRWWSDELEDEYEFDDDGGGVFGGDGELFDEPWFSKVFKTYGYVLPVVLASMLVATGPNAFLMAMAIPLAQTAVSFALRAIWGDREQQQDDDDFSNYSNDFEYKTPSYSRGSSSQQSWVQEPEQASEAATSSSTKTGSGGFGGWDELDGDDDRSSGSTTRPGPGGYTKVGADAVMRKGSRRRMSTAKMGNRYRQAPLFMRLLVAVFPFLGSWFRIL